MGEKKREKRKNLEKRNSPFFSPSLPPLLDFDFEFIQHQEAEDQGLLLPYACRMGCCTACAVRVKSGEMSQPEALGVAAELRQRGFALMCVGFARSDLVLELAEEDEVYDLQFGDVFGERATDPENGESIEKDPFALEVAFYDE